MSIRCIVPLVLAMVTATFLPLTHAADAPTFRSIFNGQPLAEWTAWHSLGGRCPAPSPTPKSPR